MSEEKRRALEIVKEELSEIEAVIAKGKGEWPKPNYVKDETWSDWHGRASILRALIHRFEKELA